MSLPNSVRARFDHGTRWMVAGSLVGAVLAFVYQRVVGTAMGAESFAAIGNAWTVMFVTATIFIVPLEQYATREASRGRDPLRADREVVLAIGVGTALVGAAIGWVGRDVWFQGSGSYTIILAAMLAGFSVYGLAKGILAGVRDFRDIGFFLIAEGIIRLGVAMVILRFTKDPGVVGWSLASAPLAFLVTRRWTFAVVPEGDLPEGSVPGRTPAIPFFSAYFAGSGAAQVLVASAPLVVKLLGGSDTSSAVVFMTFTLFRAPLTLIFSLQSRMLSALVRWFDAGEFRRLRTAAALIGGIGLIAVGLAWVVGWFVGPSVIAVMFSEEFRPSAELAAWAAAGVVAASSAQILGQLLVARAATGRLAIAWLCGLGVAILSLFATTGPEEHRVALAFGMGELAALAAAGFIAIRAYRTPLATRP